MNSPLVRIMQAMSGDIDNVAQYYSSELVKFVKLVLQVIPSSVFQNLMQISELLTHHIWDLPVKLSKDDLKDYTNYEHWFELAKLTHKISVYTEGIL